MFFADDYIGLPPPAPVTHMFEAPVQNDAETEEGEEVPGEMDTTVVQMRHTPAAPVASAVRTAPAAQDAQSDSASEVGSDDDFEQEPPGAFGRGGSRDPAGMAGRMGRGDATGSRAEGATGGEGGGSGGTTAAGMSGGAAATTGMPAATKPSRPSHNLPNPLLPSAVPARRATQPPGHVGQPLGDSEDSDEGDLFRVGASRPASVAPQPTARTSVTAMPTNRSIQAAPPASTEPGPPSSDARARASTQPIPRSIWDTDDEEEVADVTLVQCSCCSFLI